MKFDIKYFARLARIKLTVEEEGRLSGELEQILDHFKSLQELDTSKVEPMAGGTDLKNVFREDEPQTKHPLSSGTEQFPEVKDDYLSVPKVFE